MNEINIFPKPENGQVCILYAKPVRHMFVGLAQRDKEEMFPNIAIQVSDLEEPLLSVVTTCVDEAKQFPQLFISTSGDVTDFVVLFQLKLRREFFLHRIIAAGCADLSKSLHGYGKLDEVHFIYPAQTEITSKGAEYFLNGFCRRGSFVVSWVKDIPTEGKRAETFWEIKLHAYNDRRMTPADIK